MWEFSVFRALGLVIRTWPFVLLRAVVGLMIAVAVVVTAGLGARIGQSMGNLVDTSAGVPSGLWGAAVGVALALLAVQLLRGQLLRRVKVAHLAVMVEAIERRPLPLGPRQLARARVIVGERFGDAAALNALDRLVRGVTRTATGLVGSLLVDLLPIATLDRLARMTGAHLRLTLGLIEGVVLAHALRTRSENAWEAAHDGLVLYTQNARPMMVNALWLALAGWALAVVVAIAALPTATAVAAQAPGLTGAGPLLAALFGWAVKAALYDPFALACMIQVHLRLTEDQEPLPEWRGRLTQVSDKFRDLGERALGWHAGAAPDA